MVVLDYVLIALATIGFIVGLCKGLLKQVLALIFAFAMFAGTAYLFVYPKQWLSALITNETLLSVVSLVATIVALGLVFGAITALLRKILKSVKILHFTDRILGAVVGFVSVYAVIAIFVVLLVGTNEAFLAGTKALLKEQLEGSWVINNIYAENFIGNWFLNTIRERISAAIPPI